MRIASYRGETSVADLVSRLFPSSTGGQESIGRTLLKANPHLADLGALQAGAPIVVPDELPPSEEAKPLNPYAELVAQRVASRGLADLPGRAFETEAGTQAPAAVAQEAVPAEETPPPKAKRSRRILRKKK